MLCILTHVALGDDDPELVRARLVLSARLDVMASERGERRLPAIGRWNYLASIPHREDHGRIVYVHVFHCRGEDGARSEALGVPAAPGWWPARHRCFAPRRTESRAKLRLVS